MKSVKEQLGNLDCSPLIPLPGSWMLQNPTCRQRSSTTRFQHELFGDLFSRHSCIHSPTGCGCKAGTIDVSDLNSADRISAECSLCTEGLTCPVMSTVEALRSGSSPNGEDFTPALEEGVSVQLSKNLGEMEVSIYELDARRAFFFLFPQISLDIGVLTSSWGVCHLQSANSRTQDTSAPTPTRLRYSSVSAVSNAQAAIFSNVAKQSSAVLELRKSAKCDSSWIVLRFSLVRDMILFVQYCTRLRVDLSVCLQVFWWHSTVPSFCFKCNSVHSSPRTFLPGGMPGTCGGNSKGIPCGNCPADTYWGGSKCSDCSAWSVIGWILSIVIVFAGAAIVHASTVKSKNSKRR